MNQQGTKCLESSRLLLRPFTIKDAPAMYLNWASDAEVTKYLTWPTHQSVTVTQKTLLQWSNNYGDLTYYQWAIVLKELGEPIGSIGVNNKPDERVKLAHIGYCIGRSWWHQGIASEALALVIQFLFEAVGVNRVEARHDARNPHSGAVMKKCGMHYEGTLRQADRNNQGLCDACYYGILANEY